MGKKPKCLKSDTEERYSLYVLTTELKGRILTVESQSFGMQRGRKETIQWIRQEGKQRAQYKEKLQTENTDAEKKSWEEFYYSLNLFPWSQRGLVWLIVSA